MQSASSTPASSWAKAASSFQPPAAQRPSPAPQQQQQYPQQQQQQGQQQRTNAPQQQPAAVTFAGNRSAPGQPQPQTNVTPIVRPQAQQPQRPAPVAQQGQAPQQQQAGAQLQQAKPSVTFAATPGQPPQQYTQPGTQQYSPFGQQQVYAPGQPQQQQQPQYNPYWNPQQQQQPPHGYYPQPQQQPQYFQQPGAASPQQQRPQGYPPQQQYPGYQQFPPQQQQQYQQFAQPQQSAAPGQPLLSQQRRPIQPQPQVGTQPTAQRPAVAAPLPHQQPQQTQQLQQAAVKPPVVAPQTQQQSQPQQQKLAQPTPSTDQSTQQAAAAAAPAASHDDGNVTAPYIGCQISLISNANVRYEGTLYTIDPNAGTIALKNVRCYGTESRSTASFYIPPTNDVYEYIIFAGKDIKELSVIETAEKQKQQEEKKNVPVDPAIQSMGAVVKAQQPAVEKKAEEAKAPAAADESKQDEGVTAPGQRHGSRHTFAKGPSTEHETSGFAARRRGDRDQGSQRTGYDVTARSRHQRPEEPIDKNFDFTAANARFDKEELANAVKQSIGLGKDKSADHDTDELSSKVGQLDIASGQAASNGAAADGNEEHHETVQQYTLPVASDKLHGIDVPAGVNVDDIGLKYDKKKSFFDDISRDSSSGRPRENRSKNVDTFGGIARNYHPTSHGRGRGRGDFRGSSGGDRFSQRGGRDRNEWRDSRDPRDDRGSNRDRGSNQQWRQRD